MAWTTVESAAAELKAMDVSKTTCLITGGNTGFGYFAARIMLNAGATVIIACRSESKAQEAVKTLKEETKSEKISYIIIDVSNPNSVKACADKIINDNIKFDVLVNNAGISCIPEYRECITGIESTFQTNFLGPAYFTELVLEHLKKVGTNPRVVFVNSYTYPKGRPENTSREAVVMTKDNYHNFNSYFRSKYCLTSYALTMARKVPEVQFVVCDPGSAATSIAREFGCLGWFQQTRFCRWLHPADKGSINIAFCAISKTIKETGVIIFETNKQEPVPEIVEEKEQEELYALAHQLIEDGVKRASQ